MFGKDSKERKMWADLYRLAEYAWDPPAELSEAWWDKLTDDAFEIEHKYKTDMDDTVVCLILTIIQRAEDMQHKKYPLCGGWRKVHE